jgi:hypothetical protein
MAIVYEGEELDPLDGEDGVRNVLAEGSISNGFERGKWDLNRLSLASGLSIAEVTKVMDGFEKRCNMIKSLTSLEAIEKFELIAVDEENETGLGRRNSDGSLVDFEAPYDPADGIAVINRSFDRGEFGDDWDSLIERYRGREVNGRTF